MLSRGGRNRPVRCLNAMIVVGLLLLTVLPAFAGSAEQEGTGRAWAVLIGIEKYSHPKAPPLIYTVNDTQQIGKTLKSRGDYTDDCILEMTDASPERFQPTQAHLQTELAQWFAKAGPNDTMFVYFSGHGFRDKEGHLYLAPSDCDPTNAAATGISVGWLREQITQCKARFKLLVLDACHAGCSKAVESDSVPAKALGQSFEGLQGVFTLASSAEDESSLIWELMHQSLFSYWLNQGLRGHADHDANGKVTVDELYDYVYRNVRATAEPILGKRQTPVRIIGGNVEGVPVVICPKPAKLRVVLKEMAEQLAYTIQRDKVAKVGVTEFTALTVDPKVMPLLGGKTGSLGRYCAVELERELAAEGKSQFEVVQHESVQKALGEERLAPTDLQTSLIKDFRVEGKPLQVIGQGMISLRTGQQISLQCQLIDTATQNVLGSVGGTAVLTDSEWAMIGINVTKPAQSSLGGGAKPPAPNSALGLDGLAADHSHPLKDPNYPYRVWIVVDGKRREGVFHGNDLYVPLRKGETYQIWVENKSSSRVWMRLFVDGVNTLPERLRKPNGDIEEVPRQRVDPNIARPWQIDPGDTNAVKGFYSKTGTDGEYNEFLVEDLQSSIAPQEIYANQLGLITAVFYQWTSAKTRGITVPGDSGKDPTETAVPGNFGKLLGTVNIRYVEPDALQQLDATQKAR